MDVGPSFICPDNDRWAISTRGLPLGSMIGVIRSKQFLSDNPEAREKLDGLGFELDGKAAANNQRFKTVFTALKAYKEANGDMLVPQPFVIPDGDSAYPESTWGLRLGARVNAIRSQGTFVKTDPKRRELLVSQDGEAFNLTFGRCGANHPPAPFLTPFHFVAPIVALFCAAQDEIGFVWEPPPSVSGKKRGRKKRGPKTTSPREARCAGCGCAGT